MTTHNLQVDDVILNTSIQFNVLQTPEWDEPGEVHKLLNNQNAKFILKNYKFEIFKTYTLPDLVRVLIERNLPVYAIVDNVIREVVLKEVGDTRLYRCEEIK